MDLSHSLHLAWHVLQSDLQETESAAIKNTVSDSIK